MDEVSFQLPVAGYEILVRIILGYYHEGAGSEPVAVSTVADAIAMRQPNVSANNKFLQSVGVLERTSKGYQLTPAGLQLAQNLDFYRESTTPETQSAWKAIVDNNDFLQRMTTAVKVRGNMDSEAFARHIALTSGATNKPRFMRGARTIISILQEAGLITEDEDGTLKTAEVEQISLPIIPPSVSSTESLSQPRPVLSEAVSPSWGGLSLAVMVHVTPETTDGELEKLARKVKRLAELVSSSDTTREDDVEVS